MLEYFHNIGFPCPQLENPLMYYLCLSTVDRRLVPTEQQKKKISTFFVVKLFKCIKREAYFFCYNQFINQSILSCNHKSAL